MCQLKKRLHYYELLSIRMVIVFVLISPVNQRQIPNAYLALIHGTKESTRNIYLIFIYSEF